MKALTIHSNARTIPCSNNSPPKHTNLISMKRILACVKRLYCLDLANGRRLRKKQSQGAVRSENKERLVDLPRSCIALPRSHTPPLEFYKQTSISAIEASSTVSMTEPGLSDSSSLWTDDEENQASNLPRHHRGHHLVWNDTATIIIPTWSKSKYDRSPHPHTTYLHLSPLYTEMIRQELNEYKKNEMPVHNDSKIHTAWH